MSLLTDGQMAQASNFTLRLQVLLGRYAKAIIDGTAVNGQAQSTASKNLAARVQSDPGYYAGRIAISLASDGNIAGSYNGSNDSSKTDDQLDGVVQSLWNSGYWFNIL